jgi:hypothetical protein
LAEIAAVIGHKDATGDATRPARLRSLVGIDFRLLSEDDATVAPGVGETYEMLQSPTREGRSSAWEHSAHQRRSGTSKKSALKPERATQIAKGLIARQS